MTIKRNLIDQAFDEIGLGSYTWDNKPERAQSALERMNRMAARWESVGILTGYNLGADMNGESGIPDTAEEAFITNLAVRLAPTVGKTVSRETMVNAKQSYDALLISRMKLIPMQRPNIMPLGRGNPIYNQRNFATVTNDITAGRGSDLEL